MNREKRKALKDRTTSIMDSVYIRLERLVVGRKKTTNSNEELLGQISSVLTDACNSIDKAIDWYGM